MPVPVRDRQHGGVSDTSRATVHSEVWAGEYAGAEGCESAWSA